MFANNPFQSRGVLRTVNNQGNFNQVANKGLKQANHNVKEGILSLKSLQIGTNAGGGGGGCNIAAQKAANASKSSLLGPNSKIPVFRSRIPVPAANQQENKVPDQLLQQQQQLLKGARPKSAVKSAIKKPVVKPRLAIENIDNDTNCFLLSEYAPEIYKYLREVESKQKIEPNFLTIKGTVTPHMRAILLNWIIQVHQSYHLSAETLYIAVSMIDRYFAREPVPKGKIQLAGVTALFIAAKYEEIYYPEVSEFVAVCDKLYTKRDILRMELHMLGVLNFELGRPLPLHFLRRGSKAAHADGRTHMLAKYLCELMLCEYETAHWHPSLLAASALYISLRLMALEKESESPTTGANAEVWTDTVEHYTGYSKAQVIKHASVMAGRILASEKSKFQNCRTKYSQHKFMEISKLSLLNHKIMRKLAGLSVSEK